MSFIIKVIFGKEQVQVIKLYNDEPLTEEEMNLFVKKYQFNTRKTCLY